MLAGSVISNERIVIQFAASAIVIVYILAGRPLTDALSDAALVHE